MLETGPRKEEMHWKSLGCVQPNIRLGLVHRTVSGAPSEPMVNRLFSSDAAIIHQTVRWCTGLSGESSAANLSLSEKEKGDMTNSPDRPVVHRTVR
jgi:hypothetical protein